MPRPRKWPPAIQIHKASGLAKVRIAGRDYYLGKPGSPEAKAEYARLLVELAGEAGPPPRRASAEEVVTVATVAARWRGHARERWGDGDQVRLHDRALACLLADHAALPAAGVGVKELKAARQRMIQKGWCRSVVNHAIGKVKAVWRWAEEESLVPPGSWHHLRALSPLLPGAKGIRETAPRKPAEWETVKAVCDKLGPRPRAMVLLQWHTGMRPGEVRTMLAGEVDRSGELWVFRPAKHKNTHRGQSRAVVIGEEGRKVLAPWLEGKGPDDYVFADRRGRCYLRRSYGTAVDRAAKLAGAPLFPYQLRHSFKRRAVREMGLDAARAALGQKSLGTTNDYAAEADLHLAEQIARRLG